MNDVQTICKHLHDLELELIGSWLISGVRGGLFGASWGQNIEINKAKYTLCDSSNGITIMVKDKRYSCGSKLRYSIFSTLLEITLQF